MVRITHRLTNDRTLYHLQNHIQHLTRLQDQLSTGRKLDKASDDSVHFPVGLGIRADIYQNRAFQRNIDSARTNLDLTESTMGTLTEVLQQIRTLAVQGANSIDPAARMAIAEQVEELFGQVLDLANANYNGQYIFGGSQTGDAAFVSRDGSIVYQGDNYQRDVLIGKGNRITTNITGNQVFLHTPNQITAALSVQNTNAPLAEQLRQAHPLFPHLPPIPEPVPGAVVERSPNPGNYPGAGSNHYAYFSIYDTEIRVDLSVDSLEDVRDRINARVKDVTASINEKNQLVITSRRSDKLVLRDGPRNTGYPPVPPQQANFLSALGMHQRVEGGRVLNFGFPAKDPLTNGMASPTPERSMVRLQNDTFLFAGSTIGPYDEPAVPFADNMALTALDEQGREAMDGDDQPIFINQLEGLRITIDGEQIDIDLRALSEGQDYDGIPGNGDDIPGATLGDMLELINNHPRLNGRATAYINADGTGIGISAVSSTSEFKVESLRKLFGRDITTRVTVDTSTGDTGISRYGELRLDTELEDLPGALIDPVEGSIGIRRPEPMPAGEPPSVNQGFVVISNNGISDTVDLREAVTIGDVIQKINESKVGVRAELNETRTGINIVSLDGHNEKLSVMDMEGGTIARDLGLFQPPAPVPISSITGFSPTESVSTALPAVSEGAFTIEVRDGSGRTLETYEIAVSPDDTLEEIAARVDAIDGAAGPGKGLITANFADLNPPAGATLNIISNYNGHTILIDSASDTTGTDAGSRFTALMGIHAYTATTDSVAQNLSPYESSQDTAGILGIKGEGTVHEVEEKNIFSSVKGLERALRNDDTVAIQQALENLDIDLEHVLTTRTRIGSRLNRLEAGKMRLQDGEDFMRQDLSSIEDADFATLISEFTLAQTAFNAALSASGKVIQQSLLNFLG
jgi:flagellin-like hook-associated protein FlgL